METAFGREFLFEMQLLRYEIYLEFTHRTNFFHHLIRINECFLKFMFILLIHEVYVPRVTEFIEVKTMLILFTLTIAWFHWL